jgi:hypothetical protein
MPYGYWLLVIGSGHWLWFLAIDIYTMFIMAMVIIHGYRLFPMAISHGYGLFVILGFRFGSFRNLFLRFMF